MDLWELQEKYGEEVPWNTIDADDFYLYLHSNRATFELLHEDNLLRSHEVWEPVRDRCVRDLYFLSQFTFDSNPEGGHDADPSENILTRKTHSQIIDMFVKKDPTKPLSQQSKAKNRLILYPRGSQKSTWGMLDLVQWVLLDDSVRILLLTAADDLTTDIVREIKGYFTIKEARPTLFNMFFPEHCALEKDLKGEGEFTTPKWAARQIERVNPTILSKGITATVSGYHFEVLHADDAISNRNSENEEQCAAVSKRYRLTRKTLRSFAYTNLIGTRYLDGDLYGDILAKNGIDKYPNDVVVTDFSLCSRRIDNAKTGMSILIGAAMTIKPEVERDLAIRNVPKDRWFGEAGEDGVELLVPDVLKYDDLLIEYNDGPEEFETQMRQNVVPPTRQKFTRELLLKSTCSWADLAPYGRITQTWDLASGTTSQSDNCAGSAVLWDDKGVGTVVDLVVETYPNPISKARGIVQFARKHHPDVISIEDAQGARNLEPTIWREADDTNDEFVKHLVRRIHWRQVDTSKDAKVNRINNLHPLLVYGQMRFVNYLPHKEKMYSQFEKPITRSSKNDIPDCISFQTIFQPSIRESDEVRKQREEDFKKQQEENRLRGMREDMYNRMYDYEVTPQPVYEIYQEDIQYQPAYHENQGLDNILGSGIIG